MLLAWPSNLAEAMFVQKAYCMLNNSNKEPVLIAADITTSAIRSWHIIFMEHGVWVGGDLDTMPFDTHPHLSECVIRVMAMCMQLGILPRRPKQFTMLNVLGRDSSEYCAVVNAWLAMARLRTHTFVARFQKARVAFRHRASCAKKIQRSWRRAVSDPAHEVCRRRLLREFAGLHASLE